MVASAALFEAWMPMLGKDLRSEWMVEVTRKMPFVLVEAMISAPVEVLALVPALPLAVYLKWEKIDSQGRGQSEAMPKGKKQGDAESVS